MPTPGYDTEIAIGGTPTTLTEEPTTRVTANTVYRITDADRRVLDPDTPVVVEVDPDGDGNWEAAGTHTVDPYTGTVTFAADQGADALVRVSGKYVPLLALGTGRAVTLNRSRAALDCTVYGSAWESYIPGRKSLSGEIEVVEDLLVDHASGDGLTLQGVLESGAKVYLRVEPGGSGRGIATWATPTSASLNVSGGEVVSGRFGFAAGGKGDAVPYSTF